MFILSEEYISIGEAAKLVKVSIDTLRRWDASGKFKAARSIGGHRLYRKRDIEVLFSEYWRIAVDWASATEPKNIAPDFYCQTSAIFQARLTRLQAILAAQASLADYFSLLVALAGEIGNNSFDHNLGNWPDMPGIMFAYDISKGQIVLADRGQGILHTLKRIRPELASPGAALKVAFTEIISGREPESRGNGLKFVKKVTEDYPIDLFFQTGDAFLTLRKQHKDLIIETATKPIRGCLAMIIF